MFRECYFEYAGVSSQPYNLMLCYISNSNTDFDSGGKFDLKTDTLPRSHETLLYGKDYSAQPLSFEVEIVNIDDNIPLEQMIEIKNWLFGQDGWKTLVLHDEREDYFLKCIFEPADDIADGFGYKGVRCTLRNESPFWYGETKTISFNHSKLKQTTVNATVFWKANYGNTTQAPYGILEIDLDDPNLVDVDYYPTITVKDNRGGYTTAQVETYGDNTVYAFYLANTGATSVSNGSTKNASNAFSMEDTSRVAFNTYYIGDDPEEFTQDNWDQIDIHPRYGYAQSQRSVYASQKYNYFTPPIAMFKLHKGKNICRILEPTLYSELAISYTPVYRMGAF